MSIMRKEVILPITIAVVSASAILTAVFLVSLIKLNAPWVAP